MCILAILLVSIIKITSLLFRYTVYSPHISKYYSRRDSTKVLSLLFLCSSPQIMCNIIKKLVHNYKCGFILCLFIYWVTNQITTLKFYLTLVKYKYTPSESGPAVWCEINCLKCMYVCMSFIFRKSFTRYGNSHITNSKKHSNIE